MDHIDIDNGLDVPDTPNRLAAKDLNGRTYVSRESDISTSRPSGYGNLASELIENRPNVNGVGRRRLFIRPPKRITSSVNSEGHSNSSSFGLGDSLSSKCSLPFTKVSSNSSSKEEHYVKLAKSENAESKSQIYSRRDGHVTDQTKQSGSNHEHSHLQKMTSSMPSSSASKGKATDDLLKSGSSFKHQGEKDNASDAPLQARKDGSASHVNSRRVIGQKRLVRNGCISPQNIAKAKKPAVKEDNGVLTPELNGTSLTALSAATISTSAKELISENGISSTVKGKGVVIHPSSKERDATSTQSSSRNVINLISTDDKANETSGSSRDAFGSFEESGGWRSTRDHSRNMNLTLSGGHSTSERDNASFVTQSSGGRVMRRDVASSGQDSASNRHVFDDPARPKGPPFGPQSHQFNGHRPALNTLKKRLKQGSASGSHAECSTSASEDLDIILLSSPENRISTRATRISNRAGASALEPVIELDSPSSTTRCEGSRVVCSSSRDEDTRARQVEADERLARELQEQLYNEGPSFGVGQIDEDVALGLVHEDFPHDSIGGENQPSSLSGPLGANLRRRQQSRNASNISRRVPQARSQARASTSNRLARLRSRFPGQPRTLSSRGRNPSFPPNMDLDMRMHILEALEAFSNMDVDDNLLHTQRDFNENDYEMLLSLDENNHQHGGASAPQISNLPQSTVQNESLQEACAICLDTPTMGDVIRHLPCLHKFHKDCIDPWLRRKTSCPVCKCSIT